MTNTAQNITAGEVTGPRSGRPLSPQAEPPKPYYTVDEATGCWIWRSTSSRNGYGMLRYGGEYVGAHRAYFAHYVAPIPAGRVVMHVCDQPACVNPDHLVLGTVEANMVDKRLKGRANTLHGEANGWAKFSSADVLRIFEQRAAGVTMKSLAAEYGVTSTAISHVIARDRHATVPIPTPILEAAQARSTRRKAS
jgi:hypothetical protein